MRALVLCMVAVLLAPSSAEAEDSGGTLDQAIHEFFDSSSVSLFYWSEPLDEQGYSRELNPGFSYFSPYRILYAKTPEYGIARSLLVSRSTAFFWLPIADRRADAVVEPSSAAPVHRVRGVDAEGSDAELAGIMREAVSLCASYRDLESGYWPSAPILGLGMGAVGGGLAWLFHVLWPYDTFNSLSTVYGVLGASSVCLGIYWMIRNPILKREMDETLNELVLLWEE